MPSPWAWIFYSVTASVIGLVGIQVAESQAHEEGPSLFVITFLVIFASGSDMVRGPSHSVQQYGAAFTVPAVAALSPLHKDRSTAVLIGAFCFRPMHMHAQQMPLPTHTVLPHAQAGAESVYISRTLGILSGVLISLFFTIAILPSSAHNEIDGSIKKALKGLLQLHALVWLPLSDGPSLAAPHAVHVDMEGDVSFNGRGEDTGGVWSSRHTAASNLKHGLRQSQRMASSADTAGDAPCASDDVGKTQDEHGAVSKGQQEEGASGETPCVKGIDSASESSKEDEGKRVGGEHWGERDCEDDAEERKCNGPLRDEEAQDLIEELQYWAKEDNGDICDPEAMLDKVCRASSTCRRFQQHLNAPPVSTGTLLVSTQHFSPAVFLRSQAHAQSTTDG